MCSLTHITVVSRKYAPLCNISLSTKRRGGLIRGVRHFLSRLRPPSLDRKKLCLAVLCMLGSFLRCNSTTETLNPTVLEFRRRGGAYARDKNTSARLSAKNAGGAYAWGRGAYLRDTTVLHNLSVWSGMPYIGATTDDDIVTILWHWSSV